MPDGGAASAFFYGPADAGETRPAVLHLTDIFGIRDATRGMARRLAEQGFCVLQPNCFYRAGAPPLFEEPVVFGEARTDKRLQEVFASLTPQDMAADIPAYLDFLQKQDGVHAGAMGVVGYCFTGAMALRAAALCPGRIAAAASFHGGRLYTGAQDSPHLSLPQVQHVGTKLYFGHASNDQSMDEDAIRNFEQALSDWGGGFESETYNAAHGWTVPGRDVYDAAEAERAFAKMTAFFKDALAA
jgi:carboxymethylenebutenolidase